MFVKNILRRFLFNLVQTIASFLHSVHVSGTGGGGGADKKPNLF